MATTPKQLPPQKPRNFVAKNALGGGAGAHKDKKKAVKQGDQKHKARSFDMAESVVSELAPPTMKNYLKGRKDGPTPDTLRAASNQMNGMRRAKEKIHDKETVAALKAKGDPRFAESSSEDDLKKLQIDLWELYKDVTGYRPRQGTVDWTHEQWHDPEFLKDKIQQLLSRASQHDAYMESLSRKLTKLIK